MRDHIIVTAGNVGSRAMGLLATILLARTLGKEQFGIYTIAFTVFVLLTQMGIAAEVVFLRKYKIDGEHSMSYGEHLIEKFKIGVSVLVATIAVGLIWTLVQGVSVAAIQGGVIVVCAVLAHYVFGARLTVHQASGRFERYARAQLGWNLIYFTTATVLIVLGVRSIPVLLMALLLPSIPWIVQAVTKIKRESERQTPKMRKAGYGYSLAYGVIAANLIYALYQRLDVLFIGAIGRLSDVGLYGVSVRFHTLALMACSSLNVVTQAKGTNPATWHEKRSRQEYIRKSWIYAIAVGAVSLVAYWWCDKIIYALFGIEYVDAAPAARVLLLAPPVLACYMPYYYYYYAMAMHRRLVLIGVVQLVVIAALLLALVPSYGTVGAAASTVLGYVAGGILVIVDVLRMQPRTHSTA